LATALPPVLEDLSGHLDDFEDVAGEPYAGHCVAGELVANVGDTVSFDVSLTAQRSNIAAIYLNSDNATVDTLTMDDSPSLSVPLFLNPGDSFSGCKRYVAFIDVLGYKRISCSSLPDERKFKILYSLFETFGEAVLTTRDNLNRDLGTSNPNYVHVVEFSDSLYLSAQELPALLLFLESIFATTYLFQQITYEEHSDNWVPFIRSGIVHGWVVNFRDTSMNQSHGTELFRNPVGPAVADAYVLTECTGRLSGMRCFMERKLLEGIATWQGTHYQIETALGPVPLRLLRVSRGESKLDLVELAWPCHVIASDNFSFWKLLQAVRRQFEGDDAMKHYHGTVELFERTVEIAKDSIAKQAWCKHNGLLRR
jgi:hypothetical protein